MSKDLTAFFIGAHGTGVKSWLKVGSNRVISDYSEFKGNGNIFPDGTVNVVQRDTGLLGIKNATGIDSAKAPGFQFTRCLVF